MAHPAFTFPILILAAGLSRRMAPKDKLLEHIDGTPLLRSTAERARLATLGPVFVTLPPSPHPRYPALDGLDVIPLPVADPSEGMNAGLRGGIAALPADTPAVMVLLADMPDLTAEDLQQVAAARDSVPDALVWRGATPDGTPGHPIIFARDLFDGLASLTGDTGGRAIVAQAQPRVHLVPLAQDRAVLDLDTPAAWDAYRARPAKT